jgi:hypothetical protein
MSDDPANLDKTRDLVVSLKARLAELEAKIATRTVPKPQIGEVVLIIDLADQAARNALLGFAQALSHQEGQAERSLELRDLLAATEPAPGPGPWDESVVAFDPLPTWARNAVLRQRSDGRR